MDSPLRAERKKRGWSQKQLGDKVGLSAPQISRIETDGVKADVLIALAAAFDYSLTFDQISNPKNYTGAKPDAA